MNGNDSFLLGGTLVFLAGIVLSGVGKHGPNGWTLLAGLLVLTGLAGVGYGALLSTPASSAAAQVAAGG